METNKKTVTQLRKSDKKIRLLAVRIASAAVDTAVAQQYAAWRSGDLHAVRRADQWLARASHAEIVARRLLAEYV